MRLFVVDLYLMLFNSLTLQMEIDAINNGIGSIRSVIHASVATEIM